MKNELASILETRPWMVELAAQRQAEIDATAGMQRLTVRELIDGTVKTEGRKLYTWARGRLTEVSHIRWPESNPWIVCPKENGGFGISYMVSYDSVLYLEA